MKKGSTLFLKIILCFVALGALTALVTMPQLEGRAADLDLISIYSDPLIIYTFAASIPFFVALYQAFKLLGLVDKNEIFSQPAIKAIATIKYCAIMLSGLIVPGLLYIRIFVHGEDPAGVTAVGILATFAFVVMAAGAAVLQNLLRNAVDLKSENELTV